MLNTETPSGRHLDLDQYDTKELISAFTEDQVHAAQVVHDVAPALARAVDAAVPRIAAGGRLVYVGAGTSGRLGVLDSVELYPTFSWPHERAVALIAGGPSAIYKATEGAEDDREQGARDIRGVNVSANDVVILIAASGATPYVLGALDAAGKVGALTIGFANNPNAPVATQAEIGITLDTGSEVISGSTRLKAGTSQKIALNTLSSAIMVRLHKVYGNLMVDLQPTNIKLVKRAVALTIKATGVTEVEARKALEACGYRVKVAIVVILRRIDVKTAESELQRTHGSIRAALGTTMGFAP